ncbi:MAG TPA: cytochrome b/b6 domain-containing protein [Deltaproteobacteria bacterium]|nr:cytochrome b/b6 domain-containing protein [Deltaproteobacteria bacterium]
MSDRILEEQGLVQRHTLVELTEHWAIAVSGIVLVFTGLFELPIAKRYYITDLPGMAWSGDFIFSLNLHYMASVIFIAASLFHVVYHGLLGEKGMLPKKGDLNESIQVIKSFFGKGEEPPFHKYLPEQRLAYIGMAFIIAGLILSGLVKTYKNLYAPDLSYPIVMLATWTHNVFFVLFILAFIAHMAAIIIKPNRPMVRGIFTGRVRLDYARHRHPLWMEEIADEGAATPARQLDLTDDEHQTADLSETDEEENNEPVSSAQEQEEKEPLS